MQPRDLSPQIEVVYALADEQFIVSLEFVDGMSVEDAVEQSALAKKFPEIGQQDLVLGVYGVRVSGSELLKPGDRVEICRPLLVDPRDMRRELMADGKVMGGRKREDD